ncbi:MAG: rhombotarget lipoprotein [Verrucomicrobiales bacterium]
MKTIKFRPVKPIHTFFQIACASILLFTITGCFLNGAKTAQHNASVVQYLFPEGHSQPEKPQIPALHLPLKVGIAFVPPGKSKSNRYHENDISLPLDQQQRLLEQVASKFRDYKFIDQIEVIPSSYLRPEGSFDNLNQLRSMFGVDVIALVSFDQIQFQDQDAVSFAYWTLIGAYIVPGEKMDTHTMLDTTVYDIQSRTLLFRAPGVSRVKGRSTIVNSSEEVRNEGAEGFKIASTNLVHNLHVELASFQEKVKSRTNDFKIVHKPGYTGGGSFGQAEFSVLLMGGLFTALAIAKSAKNSRKN